MIVVAKIIFIVVFMRIFTNSFSVFQGLSATIESVGILFWSRNLPRKLLFADRIVTVWT